MSFSFYATEAAPVSSPKDAKVTDFAKDETSPQTALSKKNAAMLRSQTTSKRLTKNVSLGCTTNLASVGETCASLEQLAENSDGSTGCSPSVERSGHKNDEVIVFEAPKDQARIRPQYQSQLYLKDEPSS